MTTIERSTPVQPGEPAPDFTLPAVHRDGVVSLSDYRGKSPVLLAINRGLWCGFCRRHIVRLGVTQEKLQAVGVETLAIVATGPERARLYFRFRRATVPLAADPELITHGAYGLPKPAVTPELMQAIEAVRVNPTGELAEPLPLAELGDRLNRLDGFEPTELDRDDSQRQFPQTVGQFLVGRDGIIRWANVEGAQEGLAGIGKFPTDEELLAAARAVGA